MSASPMVVMSDEEVARYGRDAEAGFGALQTEHGLLPLVAMTVETRVTGVMAAIEVAQTFVNTTGGAIETTYIFPLPDRAAVHAFVMEVAGRRVEGVVEERGAAREHYDAAIALGHRAAITEEERAGVFTLRVGNLMPGEAATVRLSLVGPLPVDDGEVTFRFPLVVAPRYMPGPALGGDQAGLGASLDTTLVPDASRISPPVRLPGCPHPVRLALRVVLEDHHVRDVASSLHAVATTVRDAHVVEIQPGERLDRDFILRWRVDGAALASTLVCADDADGRGGTFLLSVVPPSTTALAQKPRDIVFVIDRSGSMEGWKMVAARRAAARMIDTLTSRDRFCAIVFDNVVDAMPGTGLVEATDRNRYRAVEALARVDARGGTELAEPLRRAVAMLAGGHDDRERVIVLVTDGQVGNEDHIVRELAPALRNVRMFTLGIDQAVNAAFLRRLAGAGGGLCELVESEDRLDAVMTKVHRRIGMPVASELAVRGVGLDVDLTQLSPRELPDIYAGSPITILGRYRGSAPTTAAVALEGTSLGDPLRLQIARATTAGASPAVAASWARARIRDLEDRYAIGERGSLEHDIVALSKRYTVLSRFTAFLAIDRAEVAGRGLTIHQVVQPVERPAGWPASNAPGAPGGTARGGAVMSSAMAAPRMAATTLREPAEGVRAPRWNATSSAPLAAPSAAPTMPAGAPSPAAPASRAGAARTVLRAKAPAAATLPPSPVGRMHDREAAAAPVGASDAYLLQLRALARELDAQARGRADAAALRVIRQRLTEWVEDVRSVGGNHELVRAVEVLVARLSAALAAGTALAAETLAVAAELAKLSSGGSPP
ncbi:MAG: VWA domain-containing protein, partial [Myxococcota bacterium]|nr:VWA domain-containing protein [Myxococcota bacterium]